MEVCGSAPTQTVPVQLPPATTAAVLAPMGNNQNLGMARYWPYLIFILAAAAAFFVRNNPAAYGNVAMLLKKAGVHLPPLRSSSESTAGVDAPTPHHITDISALHKKMETIGVRIFGSSGCMWSNKQRDELGIDTQSSFYVNCDTGGCDGITGYPTWEINGARRPGFMTAADADMLFDTILQDTYRKHTTAAAAAAASTTIIQPTDSSSDTDTAETVGNGTVKVEEEKEEENEEPSSASLAAIAKGVELHISGADTVS